MNKKLRIFLNTLLILILVTAIVCLGISEWNHYRGRRDYEEARQIAIGGTQQETTPDPLPESTIPSPTVDAQLEERKAKAEALIKEDPHIAELLAIDLDALREVNEDVIGWILIPDTVVSYPLLQWTDNDFYLNHTWKQAENAAGSIYMECQNSTDFSDFNTIIYGHKMRDESMFGSLQNYLNLSYAQEHPTVYILNDAGVFRYDFFAAHRVDIDTLMYGTKIDSEQKRTEFLRFTRDYSAIDLGIAPTIEDKILTLSTCSGAGYTTRWIVQGVFNEEGSYIHP